MRTCTADTHLHVSFDVDFLDPEIAPGVGTTVAGGMSYREAQLCMEMIADTGRIGSLDIMELNPALDVRNKTASLAVDLVESLFGKSTLDAPTASGASTGARPCRYAGARLQYPRKLAMAASLNESPVNPTPDSAALGLREHGLWPEDQAVNRLLHGLELTGGARHRAVLAVALVEGARARRDERPFLDAFLQEFGLSNQEGIALMCIAEALLRIPDDATADRLIAEKLATGDWSAHAGKSESLFVNASTWGLMLTGGILELDPAIKTDAAAWMRKLTRKAGEPLVRLAVRRAMRIIGGEFVVGRTIEEALARSAREAGGGVVLLRHVGRGRAHPCRMRSAT